ncbi:unnamed protein product [Symbiodinium natans]|uniref:SAM domain-containing protein n=1 Tax=Symbiodinium natans TaxID=878477 RepID=A0A812KTG0_9DINO|nr:unnamed protein product [Symbiodinium natans]
MGLVLRDSTPNFRGRTMPLIGPTGAGKTTLFNKLTGSTEETSGGRLTQTQHNVSHPGLEPAQGLSIIDTPGYASEGMTFDHAFELRKALTTGEVAQIVVVQDLGNSRQDNLMTMLAPINDIMSCDTFYLDRYGRDSRNTGCTRSPYRTRVFLVFTKRDLFQLQRDVAEWTKYIRFARARFPWIGPVALIDKNVSTEWLQRTVVACAGYEPLSCHSYTIPMPDFLASFPIPFMLTQAEQNELQPFSSQLKNDFNEALRSMDGSFMHDLQRSLLDKGPQPSSSSVLDCLAHFLDDLFDDAVWRCVGQILKLPADELWNTIDPAMLNFRVEKWNGVRAALAKDYVSMRAALRQRYPEGAEAVYKRCNHCRLIYVKPIGCNDWTTCGAPVHGSDVMSFHYCYDPSARLKFQVKQKTRAANRSQFEEQAVTRRDRLRSVVKDLCVAWIYGSGADDPNRARDSASSEPAPSHGRGCGKSISWRSMPAVPQKELQELGLLPMLKYETSHMLNSLGLGVRAVEPWLRRHGLGAYAPKFRENAVTLNVLQQLTEQQLRTDFEMTNVFHIRTFIEQRRYLLKRVNSESLRIEAVDDWLHMMGLSQYVSRFAAQGLDHVSMLKMVTPDECRTTFGMVNEYHVMTYQAEKVLLDDDDGSAIQLGEAVPRRAEAGTLQTAFDDVQTRTESVEAGTLQTALADVRTELEMMNESEYHIVPNSTESLLLGAVRRRETSGRSSMPAQTLPDAVPRRNNCNLM